MKNFLKSLIAFFSKKPQVIYTGVNLDPRLDQEKALDWKHEDDLLPVAQATSPYVGSKPDASSFPYPREDQKQTNECGPHAGTLALGILQEVLNGRFIRLSKDFFYRYRSNFPGAGMFLQEIGTIGKNYGSCLYTTMPTSDNDDEANRKVTTDFMIAEAAPFRALGYLQFKDPTDIDAIAKVLNSGKSVVLFIYATYGEWAREYPAALDNVTLNNASIRHFVGALPKGQYIDTNGKRFLTIQDSAQFGQISIRRLSEDFIKERCVGALYYTGLELQAGAIPKPKHVFTQALALGSRTSDVLALQQVLCYEGLLPTNALTGYFGGMTFAAVKAYQAKYALEILIPLGLSAPTGKVSSSTIAHLNKLYA